MKKMLILTICLVAAVAVWGQGLETFGNFSYAETNYADGNFVGDGGITWNYFHVTGSVSGANDNSIDGNGMILRRSAVPSRIVSASIPNGIGNFSVQMRKAYTSAGDRQLALYINNIWVADSQIFGAAQGADPTVHEFIVNGVNVPGDFTLEIRNIQGGAMNRQLTIDNISWTAYGSGQQFVANPTFDPPAGHYGSALDVTISTTTAGASIYYTLDGSEPSQSSTLFTAPVNVSTPTTIKARAYAPDYEPSAVVVSKYGFYVYVSSLSELWQQNADNNTVYHIPNNVILTFKQNNRSQKYVQDAGAAILIDDQAGKITTNYEVGDAIAGLTGKLNLCLETLQFLPSTDPGPAVSSGNDIYAPTLSIAQLNSDIGVNHYQSRLVRINDVSFDSPSGNYATNPAMTYAISDATGAMSFRTSFYDVDYIGATMHSGQFNMMGIIAHFQSTAQITPRMLADFNPAPEEVGSLGGVVTAAGAPLAGALIQVAGTSLSAVSAADGSYILHLIPVGTHIVTVSKQNYTSVTRTVTIVEGQIGTQNFVLNQLPQVRITGRIVGSDAPSVGIAGATLSLSGYESYETTTSATGQFAINNIFGNQTYAYSASAPGYVTTTGQIVVGGTNTFMGNILLYEKTYPPHSVVAALSEDEQYVDISWQAPIPSPVLSRTKDLEAGRAFIGYKIWRLQTSAMQDPASWTLISSEVEHALSYPDSCWLSLTGGEYVWAVRALYSNGLMSDAAISNALHKPSSKPAMVENLQIGIEENTVSLNWDAVNEDVFGNPISVNSYYLYILYDPLEELSLYNFFDMVQGTSCVLETLTLVADKLFFCVTAADGPPEYSKVNNEALKSRLPRGIKRVKVE